MSPVAHGVETLLLQHQGLNGFSDLRRQLEAMLHFWRELARALAFALRLDDLEIWPKDPNPTGFGSFYTINQCFCRHLLAHGKGQKGPRLWNLNTFFFPRLILRADKKSSSPPNSQKQSGRDHLVLDLSPLTFFLWGVDFPLSFIWEKVFRNAVEFIEWLPALLRGR